MKFRLIDRFYLRGKLKTFFIGCDQFELFDLIDFGWLFLNFKAMPDKVGTRYTALSVVHVQLFTAQPRIALAQLIGIFVALKTPNQSER
ncbi:hypothetical protein VCHA50P415_40059 [Vibrio chagasii]|nr:hypothetical protein VCHA27O13_80013 [Vibrio chagasii]CAH6806640.1 hypothetical protein VCHA34P129_120064 [Vibrio chagasii]CAH6837529.1 hypothetical protein VCHA34P121_10066 [Vibrio chagasii]CAH6839718.1 hypothetical protein VCHA34P114_10403 [Vibrio chagasii]CAH6849264.1 hypothetical protein VCHA36P168_10066 [Vibrio chagasii]